MTRALSAAEVMKAAAQVPADSPYRFGDKVLLDRIARMLDMTVDEMKPALLRMQRSGEIELARVDMVAGMSVPGALRRSMIRAPGMHETSGWHAVIAPPKSLTRNATRIPLEWVKAEGADRDGHTLAWWRSKQEKWKSSGRRPKIEIRVVGYLSNGQRGETFEFGPDELAAAKAKAKEWAQSTDGSGMVGVIVDVPYDSMRRFDIGEWRSTGPRGYFVWQVRVEDQIPIDCRGPIADPDEAYALAREQAKTSESGKSFVVTWGDDPEKPDFEIVKAWKGWLAEVHTLSELPRLGGRLRERRR